jgi:hypothetical protein
MADLNKLFPGFESFMDGDIEINNEVTVPESDDTTAESVADEVESEEIATEGAEIEGEAAENETAAEATNMMFDHLLMMYHHVKRFGIDRTFLSLYNNKGQLNNMIGYRFPSCESIDSVGSPRSQMSAAFIAAMEDEQGGVFAKIWNWIKAQCAKIYNFVLKIIEWFKDKFINTGARIEKLKKVLNNCTFKSADEIDDNLTAADAGKILGVLNTPAAKSINKAIDDATKEAAATAKKLEAEMANKNVNELKDTSGLSQDVSDSKAVAEIEGKAAELQSLADQVKKDLSAASGAVPVKTIYKKLSSPQAVLREIAAIEASYKELAGLRATIEQFGKTAAALKNRTAQHKATNDAKGFFDKEIHPFGPSVNKNFENAKVTCLKYAKQANILLGAIRTSESVQAAAVNALAAYVSRVTK